MNILRPSKTCAARQCIFTLRGEVFLTLNKFTAEASTHTNIQLNKRNYNLLVPARAYSTEIHKLEHCKPESQSS